MASVLLLSLKMILCENFFQIWILLRKHSYTFTDTHFDSYTHTNTQLYTHMANNALKNTHSRLDATRPCSSSNNLSCGNSAAILSHFAACGMSKSLSQPEHLEPSNCPKPQSIKSSSVWDKVMSRNVVG